MAEFELMCDKLCGELNVIVKQRVSTMLSDYKEKNDALEGLFQYVVNMPEFKRRYNTRVDETEIVNDDIRIVQLSGNNIVLDVEEESEKDESENDEQVEDKDEEDDSDKDEEDDSDKDDEEDDSDKDEEDDSEKEDEEENEMKLDLEKEEDFTEIEIDDVTYCTNDDENGFIYKLDDDGTVGDKVGYIKEGEPIFYE